MKPERSNTIAGGQVPIIPDPWQSEAVGLPGQYSKTLSSRKKKKKSCHNDKIKREDYCFVFLGHCNCHKYSFLV
jgi:hypothetical protein